MQTIVSVALILAALSTPGMAQVVRIGPDRYAVTLSRADLPSDTPALARRSLRRIERAAGAVCGVSGGSLRVVDTAARASACWREAVGEAVQRIDAPPLSHARHYHD